MTAARDRAALPTWAQEEMRRLTSEVEHWKKKAFEMTTEGKGSNVSVVDGMELRALPYDSTVRFRTIKPVARGSRGFIGEFDVSFGCNRSAGAPEGSLVVSALHGSLVVEPAVSNVVFISGRPR